MQIQRPVSSQPLPEHAERVFKGKIFDVYQWQQELYDGTVQTFEKIKRPDTVVILPVMSDGRIVLGYQEQPGSEPFLGCLGGRVDEGEDALEAAKRELLEESGYVAHEWSLLDSVQPVMKLDWVVYVFIARGAQKTQSLMLESGERIDVRTVDFDEFVDIVMSSGNRDSLLRTKLLEAKLDENKMRELKQLMGII